MFIWFSCSIVGSLSTCTITVFVVLPLCTNTVNCTRRKCDLSAESQRRSMDVMKEEIQRVGVAELAYRTWFTITFGLAEIQNGTSTFEFRLFYLLIYHEITRDIKLEIICLKKCRNIPNWLVCKPARITLVEAIFKSSRQLLRCSDGCVYRVARFHSLRIVQTVAAAVSSVVEHHTCRRVINNQEYMDAFNSVLLNQHNFRSIIEGPRDEIYDQNYEYPKVKVSVHAWKTNLHIRKSNLKSKQNQ